MNDCANARNVPAPHLGDGYCCFQGAHTLHSGVCLVGVGDVWDQKKWSGV
jgi:hypothetical protein